MKSTLISLLILFCALCIPAFSQTIFAPPGAHWYHDTERGYYHSYVNGDTVIDGHFCRKIKRDVIKAPASPGFEYYPTLYTFTAGDTVFIYNTLFSRFTPLFIFNVNEGDTIDIPQFDHIYHGMPAVNFQFRVDSIRTLLYDTAHLKTVFVHNILDLFHESPVSIYFNGTWGAYVERIGSLVQGSIYPPCIYCGYPLGDKPISYLQNLRCYYDSTMQLKFTSVDCTAILDVNQPTVKESLSIYPNPTNDILHINGPANSTFLLTTLTGQLISQGCNTNTINVASLPAGIYLLRITTESGVSVERVTVER